MASADGAHPRHRATGAQGTRPGRGHERCRPAAWQEVRWSLISHAVRPVPTCTWVLVGRLARPAGVTVVDRCLGLTGAAENVPGPTPRPVLDGENRRRLPPSGPRPDQIIRTSAKGEMSLALPTRIRRPGEGGVARTPLVRQSPPSHWPAGGARIHANILCPQNTAQPNHLPSAMMRRTRRWCVIWEEYAG